MEIGSASGHRYHKFGTGKVDLVIEMGLGSALGEWWHVAEILSNKYTVLLYERLRSILPERTPENIAKELHALLSNFDCAEKIIILAHSQGGLYAGQFARLYPHRVKGIVLLDPLSPFDDQYKQLLTPEEQKKSGFDKSGNLVIMKRLAKLHLGFVIQAVMKKAPPFYYYTGFSKGASDDILKAMTKPELYDAAIEEYCLAHTERCVLPLRTKESFPQLPLVLVTHTSEYSIKEIMEFGQTTRVLAEKVEQIWQELMQKYLAFSKVSKLIRARDSGHYLHLSEPELINEALDWVSAQM